MANNKEYKEIDLDLIYAAWDGNMEKVQELIKTGADVKVQHERGVTLLHLVAAHGNKEIVELLLEKGVKVDAKNNYGQTPLHFAAYAGNEETAKVLVQAGADIHAKDIDRQTPVDVAVREGYDEMIRGIGNEQIEKEYQLKKMGELLVEATRLGDTKKVLELIAGGVDVNVQDAHGMTPISIAGSRDDREMFRVLYENGADVNIPDIDGWTTFMHISENGPLKHEDYGDIMDDVDIERAEKMGNMKLVEEIKQAKEGKMYWEDMQIAECEERMKEQESVIQKNEKGLTPLHEAKSVEEAKALLEKGAEVNVRDRYDRTPLHLAVYLGKKELAELLIHNRADLNAKDKDGKTPLHYAVDKNNKELTELLLDMGAHINVKNNNSFTPLHAATLSLAKKEIVELLINRGADMNVQDKFGNTPLHTAIFWTKEVAQLLIDKRANVNIQNKKGNTPIHDAAKMNQWDITKMLIKAGADLSITNNLGRNPFKVATRSNTNGSHIEVAGLLYDAMLEQRSTQTMKRSRGMRM